MGDFGTIAPCPGSARSASDAAGEALSRARSLRAALRAELAGIKDNVIPQDAPEINEAEQSMLKKEALTVPASSAARAAAMDEALNRVAADEDKPWRRGLLPTPLRSNAARTQSTTNNALEMLAFERAATGEAIASRYERRLQKEELKKAAVIESEALRARTVTDEALVAENATLRAEVAELRAGLAKLQDGMKSLQLFDTRAEFQSLQSEVLEARRGVEMMNGEIQGIRTDLLSRFAAPGPAPWTGPGPFRPPGPPAAWPPGSFIPPGPHITPGQLPRPQFFPGVPPRS